MPRSLSTYNTYVPTGTLDAKIINFLVFGIILFIMGIYQIMDTPGTLDYILTVFGFILIIIAIAGFRKGKVL